MSNALSICTPHMRRASNDPSTDVHPPTRPSAGVVRDAYTSGNDARNMRVTCSIGCSTHDQPMLTGRRPERSDQQKHAGNASGICGSHLRAADPTYGRTYGLTKNYLTVSNAVEGRFAHARTANRRFAVPIVEIHSPEIGLSTGLWGAP